MIQSEGPELVLGLVTPIGTDTAALAAAVVGALSNDYGYQGIIIRLSDHLPASQVPLGEREDERVRRLIAAGDSFCIEHMSEEQPDGDPAAMARLAIRQIQRLRLALLRQDGESAPVGELRRGRPRTAYILHSLKRPAEVQLLRRVYGEQFVLIGSQATLSQRETNLRARPMTTADPAEKLHLARELIRLDAEEREPMGQRVNETYPLSDFFLSGNQPKRVVKLLFGEPIAPEVGEYAMYVARAARARSLSASRKVGAAIVVDGAVVATGYNDVPPGQTPDVLAGEDTSELFKRENVADTLRRLRDAKLLSASAEGTDDDLIAMALTALKGGELLSVVEYQRAVHAEAKALDDATVRGVRPVGGDLYVTTYPCHLCYKHALSARIATVRYIEPYPKSRASAMYPAGSEDRLVPYEGVAPRRYVQVFDDRPAFMSDPSGKFIERDRSVASPLLGQVRNDDDRHAEERLAINGLKEDYQ